MDSGAEEDSKKAETENEVDLELAMGGVPPAFGAGPATVVDARVVGSRLNFGNSAVITQSPDRINALNSNQNLEQS